MPDHSPAEQIAQEWLDGADQDLKVAAHTLSLGKSCPAEIVCYHAQQCVEKSFKAALIALGRDFPRTHDIEALLDLLPRALRPRVSPEEQARLTLYATEARYPGGGSITLTEARLAVALARRVRLTLGKALSRGAMGGRRNK